MTLIDGGVCAAKGFTASGIHCGIRANRTKRDIALIYSEKNASCAAVYTTNLVKGAPLVVTKENLADGYAQAVICNSGNANTCNSNGIEIAKQMCDLVAKGLSIDPDDVVVASTGVIGQQLPVEKIEAAVPALASGLSKEGHAEARTAIMTTDTHYKECAVECEIGGKKVRIGAMCKGSGMIHINLGTMLAFVTSDCAISSPMLDKALRSSVAGTYNCVSVDGDTSTNDTLTIIANGMAGNAEITGEGKDYDDFLAALNALNTEMAKKIAGDGEGATRLLECNVSGAKDVETARTLAKSVISSSLVKAAIFGKDANFGRFLCAMGYSGAEFDPDKVTISYRSHTGAKRHGATDFIGDNAGAEKSIMVFEKGVPLDFDEAKALEVLSEDEIIVDVQCGDGNASGTAWGCDLTYDYVKINGDYRT